MKLSVVLIWFCVSSAQLQKPDDQPAVENGVQSDVWTELRELRNMMVKLKERLQSSESQIEELKKQNTVLKGRVDSAERSMDALRKENTYRPKVAFAFASGLRGYYGPFSSDTTLVFHNKITNIGNAYNPTTGVFTAPVRGVYYFRFNVLGQSGSYWTNVNLMKNHERIVVTAEPPSGTHQYAVGGVTLQLERGDVVYVKLRATCQIYDSDDNHTSFSGFLIFPK